MEWPRLTNSKPLIPLLQHLLNKEIAGVPVSGVIDAPSLHVLLVHVSWKIPHEKNYNTSKYNNISELQKWHKKIQQRLVQTTLA